MSWRSTSARTPPYQGKFNLASRHSRPCYSKWPVQPPQEQLRSTFESILPTSSAGRLHQHKPRRDQQGYQARYDFVPEFDCLDDYLHFNEEAHPVADYHPNDNAMLLHPARACIEKDNDLVPQAWHQHGRSITMDELINANIYKACATSHNSKLPFPKKRSPQSTIWGSSTQTQPDLDRNRSSTRTETSTSKASSSTGRSTWTTTRNTCGTTS